MKQKTLTLFASAALVAAGGAHADLVVEQTETNNTFGIFATGQSFTPNVGIQATLPDTLPPASTTTIDLTSFTLYAGGNGGANKNDNTSGSNSDRDAVFLLIYDANPSGAANLIGASTGSLDLNPTLSAGSVMLWNFNNLTLEYGTEYFAVMASSNTGTDVNDIGIGIQVRTEDLYTGGQGLQNNFVGSPTQDAKFTATFTNPVPEPSALALLGFSSLCFMRRRRG